MKKILSTFLILTLILLSSVSAFAASGDKGDKLVDVNLTATSVVVSVGETVLLSASTQKHGSDYTDNWENTVNQSSHFDHETGRYESTSEFTAQVSGIYTITYSIAMNAGKSKTRFIGNSQIIIEVLAENSPATVSGADIRNLLFEEIKDSTGKLIGHSATGDIYVLYSDDTSVFYESIFVFMNSSESTKTVKASIVVDQNLYDFDLEIKLQ